MAGVTDVAEVAADVVAPFVLPIIIDRLSGTSGVPPIIN